MAVDLASICADCVLLLNAGSPGAYSSTVIDPRWATQQIVDAVLDADGMVCAAIFQNKNHPRNVLFYTTQTGLAHGDTVGSSQIVGPITSVMFVVTGGTAPGKRQGIPWEAAEIQHEIINALGLDYDPHYDLDGQIIWHNGAAIAARSGGGTVSVDVVFPEFSGTSSPQAPDEYAELVLAGAMAILVPVEGENVPAANHWLQAFEAGLQMIMKADGSEVQAAA